MTLVLYLKEGCPYCQKVKDKIKEKKYQDVEMYYVGKDFNLDEYKKKYGKDATFPRGYKKEGEKVELIGDSGAIVMFVEKEK